MTDTPEDWILIEAAKRSGYAGHIDDHRHCYSVIMVFRALCDMIAKYEKDPVDRKLLCAEQAMLLDTGTTDICVRAIELWEEGFGK